MRVLAIDHGSARAGCAISDPTGTIARPLGVIEPPDPRAVAELAAEHQAELVIVGLPVSLSGAEGPQATRGASVPRRPRRDPRPAGGDLRRATDHAPGRALGPRRGERPADALAAAHLLESYLQAHARASDEVADRAVECHSPSEDDAARERERRRAEREARRRERVGERAARDAGRRSATGSTDWLEPRRSRRPGRRRRLPSTPPPAALAAARGAMSTGAGGCSPSEPWWLRPRSWSRPWRRSAGSGTAARPRSRPRPGPPRRSRSPRATTASQVAEIAKQAGLRGDYLKASQSFKGFDPARYGAQSPQSLEGFLFPATYELPRRPTGDDLVARQLAAFKQNISQVNMGYARSKNLTTYDLLIIGSMIEREVQVPKERKLVAAVIYNRLHNEMPLQIDATVRYASGNFTEPISPSELQIDSPYNTYENSGLPPGPIGNPGLDSIEAAAHPARVSYLYYVVKPNTCGEHTFATTEAQFNRAKAAYDQARAANGGNAPTPANCP